METTIKTRYRADIGELHRGIYNGYNNMLKRMNVNPLRRAGGVLGLSQNKIPTILEFRQRISQVQRSKQKSGIPEIDDAAAQVNATIKNIQMRLSKAVLSMIKDCASLHGFKKRRPLKRPLLELHN